MPWNCTFVSFVTLFGAIWYIWYDMIHIHQPSTKGFCQFFQHKSSITRPLARPPHHGATMLWDDAWPSTQGLVPWWRATQQTSAAPDGKVFWLQTSLKASSHSVWFLTHGCWCLFIFMTIIYDHLMFFLFPTSPFLIATSYQGLNDELPFFIQPFPSHWGPWRCGGSTLGGWHEGISRTSRGSCRLDRLEHLFQMF